MRNKEAETLLTLASGDFDALEALVNMDLVNHVVFFLSQQTVEKCIKAVLSKNNIKFPFTHDIIELLKLLEKNDLVSPITYNWAEELNNFAVESRYFLPEAEFPDAKEVLEVTRKAITWCKEIIEK